MDPITLVIVIVPVVVGILAFLVAYVQWRETHADRAGTKLTATIKTVVSAENKPIDDRMQDHTTRITQMGDRLIRIEDMMKDFSTSQRASAEKISKMEVKVDMYWTSFEQAAIGAAKILHQPDPRRAHIDHLLEAFMEGTLTSDERIELKKILVQIRNFEPSQPPMDFPVYPGEQTAAAILLSTMDLVDPNRMAALGHSTHRNHGSAPTDSTDAAPPEPGA